jgi:hypothetical protein
LLYCQCAEISPIIVRISEGVGNRGGGDVEDRPGNSVELEFCDKAVLVIVTDGLENHSRKHTFDSIKELIHARQDKGWLIVFLGAGLAAAQQGTAMGIQAGSVANIGMDEQSLHNTMSNVRCMLDDYAATADLAEAKAYAAGAAFSIKARAAMGDPSGGAGLVKPKGGKTLDPSNKARKEAPSLSESPDDTWATPSSDAWGA